MLKVITGRGFQMEFENGWTVSVMFGKGNYSEHYDELGPRTGDFKEFTTWKSKDAEIAAWDSDNVWYDFEGDTVKGYCSAEDVASFIEEIKNK